MKVQPAQLVTSGDGSAYIQDIAWSGWGDATATGTGTLELDDCKPDCASGTYTGYPATVNLSSPSAYNSDAEAYSEMMISAPTAPYGTYTFSSGLVP